MASTAVLSNFEIRLSGEIIQDLILPGKVFKTELIDITPVSTEASQAGSLQQQSVFLEKINDSLVKLFVTVYKSGVVSSHVDSQTTAVESGQQITQTNSAEWSKTGKTQTNSIEWTGVAISQTDSSEFQRTGTTQTSEPRRMQSSETQWERSDWTCDSTMQTNSAEFSRTSGVQTDTKKTANIRLQTEQKKTYGIRIQTDVLPVAEAGAQTDETRITQTFAEIGVETFSNLSTQVDNSVQAVAKTSNIRCQASALVVDGDCQVSVEVSHGVAQTESVDTDCETQTDLSVAWRSEAASQATADVAESAAQATVGVAGSESQTDMSWALRASQSTQAGVDVSEMPSQTDSAELTETSAQTLTSAIVVIDEALQAVPDSVESVTQTSPDVAESGSQTDVVVTPTSTQESQAVAESMESWSQMDALPALAEIHSQTESVESLNRESQATVNCADSRNQTDSKAVGEIHSQTDASMLSQTHASSQAVADTATSHTEYDPPAAGDATAAADVTVHDTTMNESFDDYGSHDISVLSRTVDQRDTLCDASAQTDPVTIIIGDASFLVSKLKSSAVNPSRITTSGNEIEIELSADSMASDTTDDTSAARGGGEEKENKAHVRQPQRQLPQQPISLPVAVGQAPLIRGAGVICRGGIAAGGPRFRMPVTMPVTTAVRPTVIRPSGLLIRAAAAPRHVAAASHPGAIGPLPVLIAGPQPVAGGSFSCPFCALRFIDSPALYEHLSVLHTTDQKVKWSQPRGRTGKTIGGPNKKGGTGTVTTVNARGSEEHEERDPPVLTPFESSNVRTPLAKASSAAAAVEEDATDADGAELFEDPVGDEPEIVNVKKGRSRASKSTGEAAPPVKKARVAMAAESEEEEDDDGEAADVKEEKQRGRGKATTPGKRGGRTPRRKS